MAEFEGERTYPIYNIGYSVVVGGDAVGSFASAADTAGTATIIAFNDSLNVVEGAFSFEITASIDFDSVNRGELFSVTGRFRSKNIKQD